MAHDNTPQPRRTTDRVLGEHPSITRAPSDWDGAGYTKEMSGEHPAIELLRSILRIRYPDAKVEAFLSMIGDARSYSAPQTLMGHVEGVMSTYMRDMTPSEWVQFAGLIMPVAAKLDPMNSPEMTTEPALSVRRFVADAAQKIGPARAQQFLRPALEVTNFAGYPSGFDIAVPPTTWEGQQARLVKLAVGHAEAVYKPSLRALLALALDVAAAKHRGVPSQLGELIKRCETEFDPSIAKVLLMPNVVLVRNSDQHMHTRYDERARAVTFINVDRNGAEKHRLVMSDRDLASFTEGFTGHSLMMLGALQMIARA